ncbi:uncharacterized protein MYCGRDRAFT_103794 [Zymoseptoria tritici IPO323]|uniref:Uncharacterized protein n=1 Tax=Zymoseptoria tritici (strain CBS 115943 / IPO323) TaxID=336722 RepID=F9X6W6_ZYMTI|nr:uncharacterized protein MYCGRDRAFT_103794 [Zymoseptoria tritici IPO323]EGP88889.1 hypothetical protein MYCGRDRAFT_103794 [Zymoseptoria tritici IPO323]
MLLASGYDSPHPRWHRARACADDLLVCSSSQCAHQQVVPVVPAPKCLPDVVDLMTGCELRCKCSQQAHRPPAVWVHGPEM